MSARVGADRWTLCSKPAPAWEPFGLLNARLYLLYYSSRAEFCIDVLKWLPGPNWLAGGKRGWNLLLSV